MTTSSRKPSGTERHGRLVGVPPASVSKIASELAGDAWLNAGSARAVLRTRMLKAQSGSPS